MIQLLPIKQVVSYFFIDNPANEELVEIDKGATKNFRFLDEDHKWLPGTSNIFLENIPATKSSFFHFAEALPALYLTEIQTPPPNRG